MNQRKEYYEQLLFPQEKEKDSNDQILLKHPTTTVNNPDESQLISETKIFIKEMSKKSANTSNQNFPIQKNRSFL